MAFEYRLPDVGEGVAEGEIVAWHVEPGDEVEEDEVLAEVETDKAVVDLPSPVAGTIRELHVDEGEVVPVGDVVVSIETDEDVDGPDEASPAEEDRDSAVGADEAESDPTPAIRPAGDDGQSEDDVEGTGTARSGRVFAPPHVRRLARELGVDLDDVEGSGAGGRVTTPDVRAAADGEGPSAEVAAAGGDRGDGEEESAAASDGPRSAIRRRSDDDGDAERSPSSADRERTLAAPATRKLAEELGVDLDDVPTERTRDGEAFVEPDDVERYARRREAAAEDAEGDPAGPSTVAASADESDATAATGDGQDARETREPYRGIRRTIGERMTESAATVPHATHHDRAVVDDLVEVREQLQPAAEDAGVRLTYMPFVMTAVVAALRDHPVLNATLDEEAEEIVYRRYYNIGIATATDAGLMVPVVEDVDEKGLLELASDVGELTERARDRSIAREEMQGGTFSITNFGAIGGEYATPIVNYPETAILGLGSIRERPVVADGEVVASHTLPLSLSIDHRVVDGADAARFVNDVVDYLETPSSLLLY